MAVPKTLYVQKQAATAQQKHKQPDPKMGKGLE